MAPTWKGAWLHGGLPTGIWSPIPVLTGPDVQTVEAVVVNMTSIVLCMAVYKFDIITACY